MRTLLLCVLLAGCGNNSDKPADAGVDDLKVADASASKPDLKKAPTCDPVAQTCTDPAQKCTLFTDDTTGQTPADRTCVAVKGTNADGQTCTRVSLGDDDCAKGLLCTIRGVPGGGLACRKMCHAATDCNPGEKCTSPNATDPTDGICVPSCTPFSTTCGTGNTCGTIYTDITYTDQNQVFVFTCRAVGPGVLGDGCMGNEECGPNLYCDNQGTCSALCDDTHQCAGPDPGDGGMSDDGGGGLACQPLVGNAGVCM